MIRVIEFYNFKVAEEAENGGDHYEPGPTDTDYRKDKYLAIQKQWLIVDPVQTGKRSGDDGKVRYIAPRVFQAGDLVDVTFSLDIHEPRSGNSTVHLHPEVVVQLQTSQEIVCFDFN